MELLTADPTNDEARRRIAEIRKVDPQQVRVGPAAAKEALPEIVEVDPTSSRARSRGPPSIRRNA